MGKTAADHVQDFLIARLDYRAWQWLEKSSGEIEGGVAHERFCALLSLASRHAAALDLRLSACEIARAEELLPGWNPERWTLREALRVALILARPDLAEPSVVTALEEAFRYADVGELCALYRALPLLPDGERFAWRAGEGCRTNMSSVFESVACDSPYPARHLDDIAWRQLVMKAVFIGAPLWRVHGLDERLTPELARMALDLVEERRSASRQVQPALWLCLGEHAGDRGVRALEEELESGHPLGRRAAILGLRRAGRADRVAEFASSGDGELAVFAGEVRSGECPGPLAFRQFDSWSP